MSFSNKVVIVTGSSSGIGAVTAVQFAKEGAQVAIVGRNEANLNKVARDISKIGKAPLIIKADISKHDELKSIIKKTIDKFGRLDVLLNNAGIYKGATLDSENILEVYDEIINTNLRAVFALTNLAIPHLSKTKGNIVNISSIAGAGTINRVAKSGLAAYCTSKAGLNHFSRYAAMELAPKGIRVNVVSPGPVETPMLRSPTNKDLDEDAIKKITALEIITESEEIADMILYLASDKARSITGSNNLIDAGALIL